VKVIVTGAGPDSIGLATATALRDLGHEVLVSTRSRPVDGFGWHPLDLTDRTSVAAFANWALAGEPIDVLVNNAGIHLDLRSKWTEPHLLDGHEIHWRTNYLGTVDLTQALLPALLERGAQTGDARIVHLVSQLHARGRNEYLFTGVQPYNSWKAYGTTKLALIHDAARLSRLYAESGLRAVSAHPGKVFTCEFSGTSQAAQLRPADRESDPADPGAGCCHHTARGHNFGLSAWRVLREGLAGQCLCRCPGHLGRGAALVPNGDLARLRTSLNWFDGRHDDRGKDRQRPGYADRLGDWRHRRH
jgi:NAD(P)-dependent dehydrogenase (short-subunit alcohol dehydrogenase family)